MSIQATRLTLNSATKSLDTAPFELAQLADHEVRIEVLFNSVSRNDVLLLEGAHSNDYLGVGAVGRIVAVGKEVGSRKVGEVVGVFHENVNRGLATGFSSHLQVNASQVVFLPTTIPLPQASSLLTDGIVAFNALENIPKGSPIAVVGSGNLAYLAVQFAKKVFGLHVTIFSLGAAEGVSGWGADAVDAYSLENTKKYEQKFDAVVVAEQLGAEISQPLQNLAIRTGRLYFLTQFTYAPSIGFFDLIICQREFIGVKRGSIAQYVKMLHAASFSSVSPRVAVLPAAELKAGFQKARESNFAEQVVLQY